MNNTNWKPFIMFGLMIGFICFIGLVFLAMMFFRSGDIGPGGVQGSWWPGMWGMGPFMIIFPCFGLVIILFMLFFGFRMMAGGGGPMSGMTGPSHDSQSQRQDSPDTSQETCPACASPIQSDWKVCPHCGQELADKNL